MITSFFLSFFFGCFMYGVFVCLILSCAIEFECSNNENTRAFMNIDLSDFDIKYLYNNL